MSVEKTIRKKTKLVKKVFQVLNNETGEIYPKRLMEITTEDDIKDVGFLKIWPEYLINYMNTKGNCACRVLAYLIENMNTKNIVYITQRELAGMLKISLPTTNKIIHDLEEYAIIRLFRGKIMINPAFLVYGSSKRRAEINNIYNTA